MKTKSPLNHPKYSGGLFIIVLLFAQYAAATQTIRLACLYPKSSMWGKELETMAKVMREKMPNAIDLRIYYNGSMGDEPDMVKKMNAGNLDGAFISAAGLGKIYAPISAMEMPGLFKDWNYVDIARDSLNADFKSGLSTAGYTLGGWYDIGQMRWMSAGFAVNLPADFKTKKPVLQRDNTLIATIYTSIGGITPVTLNYPEILPNLNTGATNAILTSALLAESLQWSSKISNMGSESDAYSVGGFVIKTDILNKIPQEDRNKFLDIIKGTCKSLVLKIRKEDQMAFIRLKAKMKVSTRNASQITEWKSIYKKTRQKLSEKTFSATLVANLEKWGGM